MMTNSLIVDFAFFNPSDEIYTVKCFGTEVSVLVTDALVSVFCPEVSMLQDIDNKYLSLAVLDKTHKFV